MSTEARKAQYRLATAKNIAAKREAGYKRLWIPPSIIDAVKRMIKEAAGK